LTASATCAAVRSKISNPCLTGFVHAGKPIMGHLVPLERPDDFNHLVANFLAE